MQVAVAEAILFFKHRLNDIVRAIAIAIPIEQRSCVTEAERWQEEF